MNDIIKITKSLEDSNVLICGIDKTVKHEIKKQQGGFLPVSLAPLAASLAHPVTSSVVKGVSGRGVRRAGRGYIDKNFLFHLLSNIDIIKYLNYEPRFNDVFSRNNLSKIRGDISRGILYLNDKIIKGHLEFHYLLR